MGPEIEMLLATNGIAAVELNDIEQRSVELGIRIWVDVCGLNLHQPHVAGHPAVRALARVLARAAGEPTDDHRHAPGEPLDAATDTKVARWVQAELDRGDAQEVLMRVTSDLGAGQADPRFADITTALRSHLR